MNYYWVLPIMLLALSGIFFFTGSENLGFFYVLVAIYAKIEDMRTKEKVTR